MMMRGVRVVSDDQECLVNFSMSGCFDIYMFSPMRFSVSIPWFNGFWSFPRYAGPFYSTAKEFLFIDRKFLAENQL